MLALDRRVIYSYEPLGNKRKLVSDARMLYTGSFSYHLQVSQYN